MPKELTMKEIQAVSLEILKQVADLCEELHLRYALIYGTLIGAVRHHGYIPWDDDVDIMMPRPDYDKLLDYLSSHKLPNLTLFNRQTCPEYPYMISRISDDRYILEMENEESVGMGIFIDIYPYDGLGKTKEESVNFGLKGDRLSSLCYQATRKHFAIETTTSPIRKLIKYPVFLISKIIGCGFASRLCGYRGHDTLKIGVGMMTRGEVALIVAQRGLSVGMLDHRYFTAVILLIIISSIITPLLLKYLYSKDDKVKI